jgi:hypothetical protein
MLKKKIRKRTAAAAAGQEPAEVEMAKFTPQDC